MRDGARVAAVIEVLEQLGTTAQSADEVLHVWLRQRRYIGSKDRRRITDLFYIILRHRLRLGWHCQAAQQPETPRMLTLAALRLVEGLTAAQIEALFDGTGYGPPPLTEAERQALFQWQDLHPSAMPETLRVECPPVLAPSLQRQFGADFSAELAALIPSAPTDLRVNRHKTTPAEVMGLLTAEGRSPRAIPALADGIRLPPQPGNLRGMKAFADGWFEPQDTSSQLAVQTLLHMVAERTRQEPRATVRILDFCAGAGGKTLALAAALGPRGEVLAWDSEPARLRRLPPRLARAGTTETVTILNDPAPHLGQCDAVLVDAPCTGTGTWRRHPEARGRYGLAEIADFVTLQRKILTAAAHFVRPGGRMMYCTCSLLPEENQEQAAWFTATQPMFRALPLPDILPADGILSPYRTGTDGFFVAVWERDSLNPTTAEA